MMFIGNDSVARRNVPFVPPASVHYPGVYIPVYKCVLYALAGGGGVGGGMGCRMEPRILAWK